VVKNCRGLVCVSAVRKVCLHNEPAISEVSRPSYRDRDAETLSLLMVALHRNACQVLEKEAFEV
jgi:hypothetical protein